MNNPTILVTGATGHTGRKTVEILLEKNLPVRALVRANDDRATQLRKAGAEVVIGDFFSLNVMRAALSGIRTAYFVYPIAPGLIDATVRFAFAAREAGVRSIVNMSQITARRESTSYAALDHYIAERVLEWAGLGVTHLRPTHFAQWLIFPPSLDNIVRHGEIRLPFGEGRHAPVAVEDVARTVAAILEDPRPHWGKTYNLSGPTQLDQQGIADAVSKVLGRSVKYKPISLERYHQDLDENGLHPYLIQHLIEVAKEYQQRTFEGEDDGISELTGRNPMTVQEFVGMHRHLFERWGGAPSPGSAHVDRGVIAPSKRATSVVYMSDYKARSNLTKPQQ